MSQIKVGDRIVFVPSKFFPNDPVEVGTIIGREQNMNTYMYSYSVLWDNGKKNMVSGYLLDCGGKQWYVFSNRKKALAFLLSKV